MEGKKEEDPLQMREAGARKRKHRRRFPRWRAAAVPLTNVKLSKSVNPLVRRKNRVRTGHSCTPGRGYFG